MKRFKQKVVKVQEEIRVKNTLVKCNDKALANKKIMEIASWISKKMICINKEKLSNLFRCVVKRFINLFVDLIIIIMVVSQLIGVNTKQQENNSNDKYIVTSNNTYNISVEFYQDYNQYNVSNKHKKGGCPARHPLFYVLVKY